MEQEARFYGNYSLIKERYYTKNRNIYFTVVKSYVILARDSIISFPPMQTIMFPNNFLVGEGYYSAENFCLY